MFWQSIECKPMPDMRKPMNIQSRCKTKTFKWTALFLPADTTSRIGPVSNRYCKGAFGHLKYWLWIAISIALALSIGQL